MPDPQPLTEAERDDLVAYLDGELAGEAKTNIESRLVNDPAVRAEADALKRAWDLLDALPKPEPSTDFVTRTLNQISAIKVSAPTELERIPIARGVPWYRRTGMRVASWVAAGLLAIVVGYLLTPGPRQPVAADMDPASDPLMAKEPTAIENLPLYLAVENIKYLQALDKSDLFGDDGAVR
jgi:anti-sigma factor RsiW